MVGKSYSLSDGDAEKLISYACRYRQIKTVIDEGGNYMLVYTTFADNDKPTSIADKFDLNVVSDSKPQMSRDEYTRRVEGKFPGSSELK